MTKSSGIQEMSPELYKSIMAELDLSFCNQYPVSNSSYYH